MGYEVLTRDLLFGEAPRWREGRLWFSDFYDHAVKSVGEDGRVCTELRLEDQPSGLGWAQDGSLLVVSMMRRQVLRRAPTGEIMVHADLSALAPFHCNDMVVDDLGGAYVGNFGFDLHAEILGRGLQDVIAHHPTTALIHIDPNGRAKVAAADLHFPNGSVITPDKRTLVVAETLACRLTAFDIGPNGELSGRRVLAAIAPRGPDGIALDAAGDIWVANPFAPECVRVSDGKVVEAIATDHPCYACALGGSDGRTLFMLTAAGSLEDREPGPPRAGILAARVETGAP